MVLERLSREIKEKLAARYPVPEFTPRGLQLFAAGAKEAVQGKKIVYL